ncbi:MAG: DNA polymerase III subunit alpha [Bacteroidetes bacterium]|nr:DNA polymerase III subunit alpha [Bacteroidota bacterium]
MQYVSLHNHTDYSMLDGAGKVKKLVARAAELGMPALGISDHGNMYGVPEFVQACRGQGIKPVVGSEFYLAARSMHEPKHTRHNLNGNHTYHQILFAKNEQGYRNLCKLSSAGFIEGYNYNPRIDKELLLQHKEGLIATTCCLASEINEAIIEQGEETAEVLFRWWLEQFGEDYYIELQDHGIGKQHTCNEVLKRWAVKYNVPVIVTNDVHYVKREDAEAHDLLLALQTGSEYTDPNRFRFTDDDKKLNPHFYLKGVDEMAALFPDVPDAIENTVALAEKCVLELNLKGELLMPVYQIPAEFADMDAYLRHLTWEGARRKYSEVSPELGARIDHELAIIQRMGFAGYFLIVQEITNEARRRGVMVGPGRGSAAGSVVAYCTGIIDVDPIQYQLLFERFLNPERISPPDIDMDFDDEGRQQVIDFVIEKYGQQSVSQIITYGTMGAKTALRDVGRVLGVPLSEVNRIAKFIPDRPGITFAKALTRDDNPDHYGFLQEAIDSPDPAINKMMRYALTLEGTTRQTGIHAAGVIIAPGTISEYAPVAKSNRDDVIITQYEGPMAEAAGLLKMDFLGLKTLSIIKTCCQLVEERHQVIIDADTIPLDDLKTYELYQQGDTVGTFQFESDGMRKYLRQLKPTNIEDLIAMNALYRPGPMDYIPLFIDRKNGREPIVYPHPLLEPILQNTYGIMVYQEQVMQVAQVMAGYSLGQADLLRRAMGKKKVEEMEKERKKFIEGCAAQQTADAEKAGEVFDIMEKFAGYGFNKSHAAAYSILAFRTAYLKANYPAEYMAAILSHNLDNTDKLTFFMEECRRMGISVLPPCVNHSVLKFAVQDDHTIRFGLGAIKGVGEAPCYAIVQARTEDGPFSSPFEMASRIDARELGGRRVIEALANAGGLDCFGLQRSQYFRAEEHPGAPPSGAELIAAYGARVQQEKQSNQASLFGGAGLTAETLEPPMPSAEPWSLITQLNREKEVIGFYLSGHPLDDYRLEMETYTNCKLSEVEDRRQGTLKLGGIITVARERTTKRGTTFGQFVLEDFSGSKEFSLFGDSYDQLKAAIAVNQCVLVEASWQARWGNEAEMELKVQKISRLEDLLASQTRRLRLELPLQQINADLVEELTRVLMNFKGDKPVDIVIMDAEIKTPLSLHAQVLVRPDKELATELSRLQVWYTFN